MLYNLLAQPLTLAEPTATLLPPPVRLPTAALPLSLSSSRRQQIHRSRPGSRAPPAGSIACRPGRAVPALPGCGTTAAWPGAAATSRAARLQLAPGAASTAPAPRLRLLTTSSSAGAALLGWQRLPLASQIRPPLLAARAGGLAQCRMRSTPATSASWCSQASHHEWFLLSCL